MGHCRCCGQVGKNRRGCSDRGGRSHVCLKEAAELPTLVDACAPIRRDVLRLNVGAVNTDASNRKMAVRTHKELTRHLATWTTACIDLDMLTTTEWSSKRSALAFSDLVQMDHCTTNIGTRNDWIQTAWDTDRWTLEGDLVSSFQGKYQFTRLRSTPYPGFVVGHYSVHTPRKQHKKTAIAALQRSLELDLECDAVVVSGDFNSTSVQLHEWFPQLTPAFVDRVTTERSSKIDNVLFSDRFRCLLGVVDTPCPLFSHYPIYAQLECLDP